MNQRQMPTVIHPRLAVGSVWMTLRLREAASRDRHTAFLAVTTPLLRVEGNGPTLPLHAGGNELTFLLLGEGSLLLC